MFVSINSNINATESVGQYIGAPANPNIKKATTGKNILVLPCELKKTKHHSLQY